MLRTLGASIFMAAILLALTACYVESTASVEGELTPRSGLSFRNEFMVVFEGVTQDSRCPADVVCVRAGEAYAQFSFTPTGGQRADATIVFGAGLESWSSYAGYLVTLTALEPDPPPQHVDGQTIDYVAHIRIEENNR